MAPEESHLLSRAGDGMLRRRCAREWRAKRAAELEEKERQSRMEHDRILESAEEMRRTAYERQQKSKEQNQINNREKEKVFLANLEALNTPKSGANYWETVTAMVNFDASVPKKDEKRKSAGATRSSQTATDLKPGKQTDLARMRQVLLKLKHTAPPGSAPAKEQAPAAAPGCWGPELAVAGVIMTAWELCRSLRWSCRCRAEPLDDKFRKWTAGMKLSAGPSTTRMSHALCGHNDEKLEKMVEPRQCTNRLDVYRAPSHPNT
eukprot:SM000244S08556  [mRNA]  locus=s244:48691:54270:- [translate_table: standard]